MPKSNVSSSPSAGPPRIIAIDAGFANLGWAIIDLQTGQAEDVGVIVTEKADKKKMVRAADDTAERCQLLARTLGALIDKWGPRGAVVELPHGGAKSANAMRAMALATAAVACVLELKKLPAEWTSPVSGKLAVTAKKDASKEEVIDRVTVLCPTVQWDQVVKSKREHVADAIAAYFAARNGLLCRTLLGSCA